MLTTELRIELSRSLEQTRGIDPAGLHAAFAEMEQEGRERLAWFEGPVALRRSADMRYGEQVFEISVPLDTLDWEATTDSIAAAFHRRHEALFTYALHDQPVVLVNARLAIAGMLPELPKPLGRSAVPRAGQTVRRIHLGGWKSVPVYRLDDPIDQPVDGPAIFESDATTVLLRPGDSADFNTAGWLELRVAPMGI
jgi:N-methylhydantoinase A